MMAILYPQRNMGGTLGLWRSLPLNRPNLPHSPPKLRKI
jgi:hypothetical protein